MPSAPNPFAGVRLRSIRLHSLRFRFNDARRDSLEFRSTAEVAAEVDELLALQGVSGCLT
jgi:hypothetical protein